MKKKIFGGLAIFALAAIVMMNINISQNSTKKKLDVNLVSVESLADEWNVWDYITGAAACPCAGTACPYSNGSNVQWDKDC